MSTTNISDFVTYCEKELDLCNQLKTKTDPNETFYKSLPLCIIDAVFSIGVKYKSVMKAEENFISYFNLNIDREYPLKNKEYTVGQFIEDMDKFYPAGNRKVLLDIKGLLNRKEFENAGYIYWRL